VPVLGALAARCLAAAATRHRTGAARGLAVGAVVWTVCALAGTQLVAGLPVASASAATLAARTAVGVPTTLREQREFAEQLAADPYADAAGLLGALQGTDVVVAFVESYGRTASSRRGSPTCSTPAPTGSPPPATRRAPASSPRPSPGAAAGWPTTRSCPACTSTTRPGTARSWRATGSPCPAPSGRGLAHRRRHARHDGAWPEAEFFGHERVLDHAALGYRARPGLGDDPRPVLAGGVRAHAARRPARLRRDRAGVGPRAVAVHPARARLGAVGDGSVYAPIAPPADQRDAVWAKGPEAVRGAYDGAMAYTLETLVSYVEEFGDDELVLVVLGDHQPLPAVTGPDAGFDVPVSIVTRSPEVLDAVAPWGWSDGLRPAADAPVWPMAALRDRFLATFSAPDPTTPG
jgi:hypothetical protein